MVVAPMLHRIRPHLRRRLDGVEQHPYDSGLHVYEGIPRASSWLHIRTVLDMALLSSTTFQLTFFLLFLGLFIFVHVPIIITHRDSSA